MLFGLTDLERGLFDEFRRVQQDLDQAFGALPLRTSIRGGLRAWPPVNIGATPEQVDIYVFAPGMDPASLDISMQENVLSISGKRSEEVPEGTRVLVQERFQGEFQRVLSLPEDVDPDQVDARYHDGVLRITVKRRESSRPRQIQVN